MIFLRRVRGDSMRPSLMPGQVVVFLRWVVHENDIVLARINEREVIKRVRLEKNGRFFLTGDNRDESVDSRHYGAVPQSAILGVMKLVFAKAGLPRDPMRHYDVWLGRAVASVFIIVLLAQLFRIDTFLPFMRVLVPGGDVVALIVFGMMFVALPFALRLPMSPAGRVTAAGALVVAPLTWLVMSAWIMVRLTPAGTVPLLGEFVAVPATIAFIVCAGWLAAALICVKHFGVRNK